ncbi:MAG: alanine--glyoxylate aminotransferase [Planctomycetes bacterium]|jgi:alanine-glyoxylate transaminase/serine-glyoxylate transaminase/serine-pyruvate transaminase|nr:alanine--glyoxylate aminotransferase [Planctomycetota bacterium]
MNTDSYAPLSPPRRVLLGPGPSPVPASVLAALGKPTLGHLDPHFLEIMNDVRSMLRAVMRTENEPTFPMSGTGSAGMETCIVNLVEPSDKVLVGVNGVFGQRLCEVARRAGAEVHSVEREWGRALDPEALLKKKKDGPFKLLCVVHAETSTGAVSDLGACKRVAEELGALLLVDCVTSLGGIPIDLDELGIDAAYSGTQKCLSCPPGLAPVSFSPRAISVVHERRTPVASWYLDLTLISNYWGEERAYHHTAPIQMIYGLHEALRLVLEEGLDNRHARHARNAGALWSGLEAIGLELAVPLQERLHPLTAVLVPDGIDEAQARRFLLEHHDLEIGGGLGPLKGKVWRIGLMGEGSRAENVELVLRGLEEALAAQGR